jgi:integrase
LLAALPQEDRAATADRPFTPSHIRRRAAMSWAKANEKRKENKLPALKPIGLHEARHTFVSMMAAAGIPLENIGDYVGHSTVYMTDRYRHLVEGQRAENLRRFDEYLARADSTGRIEQLGGLSQPTGPSLSE